MNVDIPKDRVDVTLLRQKEANPVQRIFFELIDRHDEQERYRHLLDCDNSIEMDLALTRHKALLDLVEDTAESIGIEVNIKECQLRRRENRDCYTDDLQEALPAIESSHVTIVRDPSFAQVRRLRKLIRSTLLQRIVILSPRDRFDDLLDDVGNSSVTKYVHFDKEGAQFRMQPRIFLADERDETRIEHAVRNALDFSNLSI